MRRPLASWGAASTGKSDGPSLLLSSRLCSKQQTDDDYNTKYHTPTPRSTSSVGPKSLGFWSRNVRGQIGTPFADPGLPRRVHVPSFGLGGGHIEQYAANAAGWALWPGCSAWCRGQPQVTHAAGRPRRKPCVRHWNLLGCGGVCVIAHIVTPQSPLTLTFSVW